MSSSQLLLRRLLDQAGGASETGYVLVIALSVFTAGAQLVALVMTLMTITFQLIYALVGRVRDGLQRRAPTIDAGR